MKVSVNADLCQGHARCSQACPEVFSLDHEGHAFVAGDRSPPTWSRRRRSALMHLTFGGLGTTAAGLANIVRRLAENPDLQDRLRADHELLPKAIEELMRYDTIAIVMARTATHDVEIEHVPAGDKVLVYFVGANRDPRQFTSPDEIDIDRVPNRHLVFGAGPHRCIGSNLARLQIPWRSRRYWTRCRTSASRRTTN
jgi:cytochrome P450